MIIKDLMKALLLGAMSALGGIIATKAVHAACDSYEEAKKKKIGYE